MAQNFVQKGEVIPFTVPASTTIASGDGVVVGAMFGVALNPGVAADQIQVALEGVFTLAKGSGAISVGAKVYWDAANKVITTTASGNTFAGYAYAAALSGDTQLNVILAK